MIFIKKLFFLPFLLIFSLLFCSCTQNIITCPEDEITTNKWLYQKNGKNNFYASLYFENDVAFLLINNSQNEKIKISGTFYFENQSLIINDNSLSENFILEYELNDNKLTLKYDNLSINLTRK